MSFGGGTKNIPMPEPKLLGQNPPDLTTNEMGRPVPVLYGQRKMGITLLSQAFNKSIVGQYTSTGKDDDALSGYNYYVDFAALVCHGPVKSIDAVYFDGVKVWPPTGGTPRERVTTGGKVVAIDVLTKGTGYSASSVVTITGDGTGATAEAILDYDGKVLGIRMLTFGSGYTTASASMDIGSGATFSVNIGSEPYVDLTIQAGETWRFYWGTEFQDIDEELLLLSGDPRLNPDGVVTENPTEEHSGYAGQFYFRVSNHFLGYNRTSLQNIEIELTRYSDSNWLAPEVIDDDNSLPGMVLDAMKNTRYGLGLNDYDSTETVFDRAGFNAVAVQLALEEMGMSGFIDRTQPFPQILKTWCEHVGAYFSTLRNGRFTLGLLREIGCGDDLPTFDETCVTEVPEIESDSYSTVENDIRVKFKNRANFYNDDTRPGNSAGHFAVTEEPSGVVLDRPWFCESDTASKHAIVTARILAIPRTSGELRVRKSMLQGLVEGGGFYLNWDSYGLCWMHCRCLSLSRPNPHRPEYAIEFEEDRAYQANTDLLPDPPLFTDPTLIVGTPENLVYVDAYELPYDSKTGERPMVGFLAARPNKFTTGFQIYNTTGTGQVYVGFKRNFAIRGELGATYNAGATGALSFVNLSLDRLPSDMQESEEWLAIIGDEILLVHTPALTGQVFKAVSAAIADAGSGYTVGDVLTVVGGTGTAATLTVSAVSAGQITGVSVTTPGSYSAKPSVPTAVSGGTGSGAEFNLGWFTQVTYSLQLATDGREQFDSFKDSHSSGTKVWIVRKSDLEPLDVTQKNVVFFEGTQTFKLVAMVGNQAVDATWPEVSVTFQSRSLRPWKQRNFTAPSTWTGTTGTVNFSWTRNNRQGRGLPFGADANGPVYVFEVASTTDPAPSAIPSEVGTYRIQHTFKTFTEFAETLSYAQPKSELIAYGLTGNIRVRMYMQIGGTKLSGFRPVGSLFADLTTVTKV